MDNPLDRPPTRPLSPKKLRQRIGAMMADDRPAVWWWLSYANPQGFLGVTIVRGANLLQATLAARNAGISPKAPDAQVAGYILGANLPEHMIPYANQLLSRERLQEAGLTT